MGHPDKTHIAYQDRKRAEQLAAYRKEQDDIIRQFLTELDACTTERQRIDKVEELVFGIVLSQTCRKIDG